MELLRPKRTYTTIERSPRYIAIYNALLDLCRARLALDVLRAINGEDASRTAIQEADRTRRATLSKLIRTMLNWGVDYSTIKDAQGRISAAELRTGNLEKLSRVLATNIEIEETKKERGLILYKKRV